MAKNFSYASHRDNLCAASQKLLTLRSLMTLWFLAIFLFSISEITVTVGRFGVVMSFDSLGLSPDILRAVARLP